MGSSSVRRSAGNIKHIRPFTQLLWLAYFSKKLVGEKRTSTLRDVYYSAQAFNVEFMDQAESDELITDLEVMLGSAREEFNVFPEERSAIFGNLTVEYTVRGYEGRRLDLSSHPDGMMIGPALTTAEFRDTDADMVLAIEKGGLFTRFIEEKVHERHKAILVNTAGQPPRSTAISAQEAPPGAQAADRDTVRRRPVGSAHCDGDKKRLGGRRPPQGPYDAIGGLARASGPPTLSSTSCPPTR